MTNALEELLESMPLDVVMGNAEIEDRFERIAKLLFEKTAVKTGDMVYLFKEIEFYFYNRHHRDIITHPRNSKALFWYVNDFGGMDLNFESRIDQEGGQEKTRGKQEKPCEQEVQIG